jgi:hypothetical protein
MALSAESAANQLAASSALRPAQLDDGTDATALDAKQRDGSLARTQIVAVMHRAQAELDRCGHGRSGGALASLVIRGATGQVESAKVKLDEKFFQQLASLGSGTRDDLVRLYTRCMVGVLERARFPLFQRPVLEIDYVFRFAPPKPRPASEASARGNRR